MSDQSAAELADYDQVHANTTQYLDLLVKVLRDLVAAGIPRHDAVLALYGQILDPLPSTDRRARFDHSDVAQLLAVAVELLEPGWQA